MSQDGRLIHKDDIPVLRDMKTAFLNGVPGRVKGVRKLFFSKKNGCKYEFRFIVFGNPNAGSFAFDLHVPDPNTGDLVTHRITITIPSDLSDVANAIKTHPLIGDQELIISGSGGGVPAHQIAFSLSVGKYTVKHSLIDNENWDALQGGENPHVLFQKV